MFSKAIGGISKLLGLKDVFHILSFLGYAIVLNSAFFIWSGDYLAWIEKFRPIQNDSAKLTIFLTVAVVIFLILHTIIQWSSSFVIRVYEGYKFPLWLSAYLKNRISKKWQTVEERVGQDPQKLESLTLKFPTELRFIMPTRLGNILKASELYPWICYDIDAVVIWPRLFQLITKEQAQDISSLKNDMVFLLNLSWVSYLSSLVWIALTLFFVSWHGVFVVIVSVAAGYLFYRLSLAPALNYGLMVRVMFDLYRVPLLKALGEEQVENLNDEIKAWKMISDYFKQGALSDEQLKEMFKRKKEQS